jgi:hypothetical protein
MSLPNDIANDIGRVPEGTSDEIDWLEEGKKHFIMTTLHPERLAANYPTQDVHTPKDEADYVLGFRIAKAAWERGEGLSGIEAYVKEQDELRDSAAPSGDRP